VDEYTRECLALEVGRGMTAKEVGGVLARVVQERGVPEHIRSDNGPEFIARAIRSWMAGAGVTTLYIEPGAPWENGYAESFNSKVRDELLNAEEFANLLEARVLAREWKEEYNQVRPHSSLGYRTPAEYGEMVPRADSAKPPPSRGTICNGWSGSHSAWYIKRGQVTGKSAAFGIASVLSITTVRDHKRSRVELSRDSIEAMTSGDEI